MARNKDLKRKTPHFCSQKINILFPNHTKAGQNDSKNK
jgi:hypothetical protein